MNISELRSKLEQEQTTLEEAVNTAIEVYRDAKIAQYEYDRVMEEAKQHLKEILEELQAEEFAVAAGKVAWTSPAVTVSYDAKALDSLVIGSTEMAEILRPHRKETKRSASLRITTK